MATLSNQPQPIEIRREQVEQTFRKETFTIWRHYTHNHETGESYTTETQDQLNVQQVYNQYREAHHIPFPGEILQIRQRYGLSASKMSEVLDLGANSYRNYENGEVPSLANAKLLRLAADPVNFKQFVEEKQPIFSKNIYERTLNRIHELMAEDRLSKVVAYIWNFHLEANSFTGYVKPHFEKVANFVLYFAEAAKPLKTRLNKLLFYADFLHFQRTGFSISGCNYRAIPFGPVPSHFHELFGILQNEEYIQIDEELFDHGGTGERFSVGKRSFKADLFTEQELKHMAEIVDQFDEMRTKQLIELSHQEKAWIENHDDRNLIDYQRYAFEIKAVQT